ncbi:hypothetical protein CKM354_000350900 [Cercospora kikuchii]|uniref:TauD/TfdA-like domain-containing protein n=1 Tax=Cercospora kikuchii TaxID=84275 RepID=A0A9P3FDS3_9PEZI|nr:uncharacterized protein CKM354_000350900 [Cercospora kikuchii]GIZ40157.1 hypothetical protein CKM354_000350900 [Cercospora kikuchii]
MTLPLFRQLVRTQRPSVSICWLSSAGLRGFSTAPRIRQEHETNSAKQSRGRNGNIVRTVISGPPDPAENRPSIEYEKRQPKRKDQGCIQDRPDEPQGIKISLDGEDVHLVPVALRDLCACPQCVDTSTKQKLFYTPDIPSTLEAKTVDQDSNSLKITWTNDVPGYDDQHVTEIPTDFLRRILTNGKPEVDPPVIPRSLWDAATFAKDTKDFAYDAYMSDDTVLLKAVKQLHSHGLLFLTDVPEDEESVVRLAERIGPLKTTFYGKTWDVRSVPDAKNVAYTAQNLGFHMDLMYMEQPPHLQLLHCIRSSSSGGASLFSDSFKAVQELAEKDYNSFDSLTNLDVQFHYDHPGDNYYHQSRTVIEQQPFRGRGKTFLNSWAAALRKRDLQPNVTWLQELDLMDFVSSVAWSPPFQGPFRIRPDPRKNGDAPPPAVSAKIYAEHVRKWHQAASQFNALIHRESHIHERLMKPGECVIFDNRRVLHARRAFDVGDVGKERWLKGGYIDKDPYLSKLRILQQKYDV